jgi:hypothetical protein
LAVAVVFGLSTSSCSCSNSNAPPMGDMGGDDQGMGSNSDMPMGNGGDGGQSCTGGQNCPGGQQCVNGTSCACPPYQAICNGLCIPVANSGTNCGGCGIQCMGNDACSGGKCEANCLPGMTKCSNACVDTQTDNNHCGDCMTKCGMNMGCSGGHCVGAATFPNPPGGCAGGGPVIILPTPGSNQCAGNLAQTTFAWALCSCTNISLQDTLLTDAFDSTKGPYMPGGLGGGVGLDGTLTSMGTMTIGGTLWDSSTAGLTTDSQASVLQELHVGGPVSAAMSVSDDAYILGTVSGMPLTVGKTLYHPGGSTGVSGTTAKSTVDKTFTVPPPCQACPQQPAGAIPVSMIVAAAKTKNDDASIGLDPAIFSKAGAPQRLDLPCGNYYLSSVNNGVTLYAHGHVGLYISGNVQDVSFGLDPDATFDVFIDGTMGAQSGMTIGNVNYPALMRTYVGGTQAVSFGAGVTISGNFYDAAASLDWSSGTAVYGAVYAGDFTGSSNVEIHYDTQVVSAGAGCPTTPPADAGGKGCGSCTDCNNQACINGTCSMCTDNSQCCPPLVCQGGTCGLPIN